MVRGIGKVLFRILQLLKIDQTDQKLCQMLLIIYSNKGIIDFHF
jgi:hypothetical protein